MSGHLDADRDRHDADGHRALRALVILAPLLIVLAVVGSALGWVDAVNGALSGAPAAPVAAAAAPGVPCDTDAHCAALTAREDAAAGRVPAVAFGPSSDGGTAVSCPEGWEVTGSSVLDSRCVPSSELLDA